MNQIPHCPECNNPLEQIGKFWICPEHGQVSLEKSFTPLRIFLSYGHDSNKDLACLIYYDLKKRGHDVWIDRSEIKFGDDWRRKITDGILDSNRVLSILSKHSTRDPGVCLDEIGIAIGAKGGNIQTILVESENEVKPPPSISYIQWLDMHDWKEKRDDGEEVWNTWYQIKLAEIISTVESDESRRFAGEIKTLEEYLKPISPQARFSQLLKKRFVGRKWVEKAIEEWSISPDRSSRIFWIMGNPGVGKSAFAAHLAHYGRDKVIAVQFCEYDKPDHHDPRRIVRTLAYQIATRLPDYRKFLLTLPEINRLDRKNSSELIDYLISTPLHYTIDGARERYLIIIDALDEAEEKGHNELVEMLARNAPRLPDWIGIIVTSRPECNVIAPLQSLNPFILDTATESNRADLRDYLQCELASFLETRTDVSILVDNILEKSEGVFLYIERFCDDVQLGYISLDQPEQFPQGLGGVYFQYFQRQFPDLEEFRKDIRTALRVILAAREPLPVEILQHLFNWEDEGLRDFLLSLGSLFPVTNEFGYEGIKPYHKSLVEWLTDESKAGSYFVSLIEGHRMLARHGWQQFENGIQRMSRYILKNLPWHLIAARREDDFCLLLKNTEYISRTRDEGYILNLILLSYDLLNQETTLLPNQRLIIEQWGENLPENIFGQILHSFFLESKVNQYPWLAQWDDLYKELQEVYLQSARSQILILLDSGCQIRKKNPLDNEYIFDYPQIEVLAEKEHDRWCRERIAAGWVYGPKNIEKKTSPDIVPWEELQKSVKDQARAECKKWPSRLHAAGYEIDRNFFSVSELCQGNEQGFSLKGIIDALAKQSHEEFKQWYLKTPKQPDSIDACITTWKFLSLRCKVPHFQQTLDIFRIVKECGFTFFPKKQGDVVEIFVFSQDELECLAEKEHDRWCRERIAAGWVYGPEKNIEKKISPYIISWSDLPESIREWDHTACRRWPEFFARGGYEIRRLNQEGYS